MYVYMHPHLSSKDAFLWMQKDADQTFRKGVQDGLTISPNSCANILWYWEAKDPLPCLLTGSLPRFLPKKHQSSLITKQLRKGRATERPGGWVKSPGSSAQNHLYTSPQSKVASPVCHHWVSLPEQPRLKWLFAHHKLQHTKIPLWAPWQGLLGDLGCKQAWAPCIPHPLECPFVRSNKQQIPVLCLSQWKACTAWLAAVGHEHGY